MVELLLAKGDGNEVVIRMLASVEWVRRWVELNLAEMSAVGRAGVTAVETCPRLPRWPGKRVTKMFRHKAGVVLDLQLEGEEKAIGVTPGHLMGSVDRHEWVAAGEMRGRADGCHAWLDAARAGA